MRKAILGIFTAAVFLTPLLIAPFTIDYYNSPKELFLQLAVIVCLGLWLIKDIRQARFEIAGTRFYFLILIVAAISGLSIFWAKSRYLALRDYITLLVYFGAFFVCVNTVTQKKAPVLATFAFAAGFIGALYAVLQYYGIDFIRYPGIIFSDWRFRLYSSFGNPDFLAGYLVLIFPVGVALYLSTKKLVKKILLLSALAVMCWALWLTFSVGALAGIVVAVVFMAYNLFVEWTQSRAFFYQHKTDLPIGRSVAMLCVVLGIISLLFAPVVIRGAKASTVWKEGMTNRIMLYKSAYNMIKDHPVRGIGIGNFRLRLPEYRGRLIRYQQRYFDSDNLDSQIDKNTHNEFLQVWVETGIFGFAAFMLLLAALFKDWLAIYANLADYKRKVFTLGLFCGMLAFLVHCVISFPLHVIPCGFLFWVLAALIYAQQPREEKIIIPLNINAPEKAFLEIGVICIALAAVIWPVRIYLGDVFLKRVVDLDRLGRINKAFVEAKTAVFFDPDSNASIYVGNCAMINKDYKTATQAIQKALENADVINYHMALAEVYYKDGLPRDAINEYKKAILLNPLSLDLHMRLAELYESVRMYSDAEAECQFVLINNKDNQAVKKRVTNIAQKIFDSRFLATYYDEVQINK